MSSTFRDTSDTLELPLDPSLVALFIGYLANKGIKASTLYTQLSALAYVHKMFNIDSSTSLPFILNIVRGYHKLNNQPDTRLPITIPLLVKLVMSLPYVCDSAYLIALMKCMYLTAFFACLRIGEITMRGQNKESLIHLRHLTVDEVSFQLRFNKFKHSQGTFHTVQVSKQKAPICPMEAMSTYLKHRGQHPGPLFIVSNCTPVSRQMFQKHFSRSCLFCDIPIKYFKGHSFRIGAATLAAKIGFSDTQIRLMGRWKSNAFLRYIRASPL